MLRSAAQPRVSKHGPRLQAAPHWAALVLRDALAVRGLLTTRAVRVSRLVAKLLLLQDVDVVVDPDRERGRVDEMPVDPVAAAGLAPLPRLALKSERGRDLRRVDPLVLLVHLAEG